MKYTKQLNFIEKLLREGASVCSNFSGVGQIIIDYKQKQPSCVEKNAYVCKQVQIFMERFWKELRLNNGSTMDVARGARKDKLKEGNTLTNAACQTTRNKKMSYLLGSRLYL